MMINKIVLRREDRLKLIEKFGISESSVSQIINFRRQNLQASKVRDYVTELEKLLKEHLEADGFVVSFDYDEIGPRDDESYDSITASMFYDDLKKLKESKQK